MFVNLKATGLKKRTNNTSAIINAQIKFFVSQCKDFKLEDEVEVKVIGEDREDNLHTCVGTNAGGKVLHIEFVSV